MYVCSSKGFCDTHALPSSSVLFGLGLSNFTVFGPCSYNALATIFPFYGQYTPQNSTCSFSELDKCAQHLMTSLVNVCTEIWGRDLVWMYLELGCSWIFGFKYDGCLRNFEASISHMFNWLNDRKTVQSEWMALVLTMSIKLSFGLLIFLGYAHIALMQNLKYNLD